MLIDRAFTNLARTTTHLEERAANADDSADGDPTGVRLRTLAARPAVDVTIGLVDQLFTAVARDLTPSSMFVVTARLVATGTRVALAVDLPEGEVIARGTVRHVRPASRSSAPGFVIELDALAETDRAALDGYCGA